VTCSDSSMNSESQLVDELDSFDAGKRERALRALAARGGHDRHVERLDVGMHFHTFHSYNSSGYSPSRLAWEARKAGLHAAAICDFDVLDGLEEFLGACRLLRLRGACHVETRAFLRDFADVDITSPGEPGVTYIMGAGFPSVPDPSTDAGRGLAAMGAAARKRNVDLVARINACLPEIALDYEKDVVPLTPGGNATERHIVRAYLEKAAVHFRHADRTASFWSGVLKIHLDEAAVLMADVPAMEEKVRARLAKKGGLGYEAPTSSTFPPAEEFTSWVRACGAIPMVTWLDGTSPGESDARRLMDVMRSVGAATLNIIPDRNWNIRDPAQRKVKTAKLREIVALCEEINMPINIGVEMNKQGLPFADDLGGPELKEYAEIFRRGALIMVGQTLLARYAGFSYLGDRALEEFPETGARNRFFEAVGRLPPLDEAAEARLRDAGKEGAFSMLHDRATKGIAGVSK